MEKNVKMEAPHHKPAAHLAVFMGRNAPDKERFLINSPDRAATSPTFAHGRQTYRHTIQTWPKKAFSTQHHDVQPT